MRLSSALVSLPVWFLVVAAAPSTPSDSPAPTATPSTNSTPTPTPSPSPTPTPTPTPVPVNAFLSLDVTSGPPNTQITVNGGAFLPNEHMTLYWDDPTHVAGSAVADANGNFAAPNIKPFAGDQPGVHRLCASVAPNPCANFTLVAVTPTPSPSPTPAESPSPSPEATATPAVIANPTAITPKLSGFDVISRPPFVFLPIIGLLAIALSLGYWVLSMVRRPRQRTLPSAAVVHRAMRPDYSAGFGTPPPQPAPPAPEPSAWADVARGAPSAGAAQAWAGPQAEPPAAPELEPLAPMWDAEANPVAWGTGEPDTGYQFAPPPLAPEAEEPAEPRD